VPMGMWGTSGSTVGVCAAGCLCAACVGPGRAVHAGLGGGDRNKSKAVDTHVAVIWVQEITCVGSQDTGIQHFISIRNLKAC
jgi:hypothetical protein